MYPKIATDTTKHKSPWIDEDGDVLVSTASSSAESDVLVESSQSEDKKPRLKRKPPVETQPVLLIIPIVSTSAPPPSLKVRKPANTATSIGSASSTASTSSSAVQADFTQSSARLAPLLANLISTNKDWLQQAGLSDDTIKQLIDIVSMLPYGLNGDIKLGSDEFFRGLKKTVKRLLGEELITSSMEVVLRDTINHVGDPSEHNQKLLTLLMKEIRRALQTRAGDTNKLAIDTTQGGSAAWIKGPYQASPFSLPVALNEALKKNGPLLCRVLGTEAVAALYQLTSLLPVNLGPSRYQSKEHTKLELRTAMKGIRNPAMASALADAANIVRDPEFWDGKIYAARATMRPGVKPEKLGRVPEETMVACRMVFSLLQMI